MRVLKVNQTTKDTKSHEGMHSALPFVYLHVLGG